ncbi:MAG: hypothetical protein WC126_07185 [Proteiniphilum sp.]
MGKDTNFSGQPIFTQLLNLLDKSKILKASRSFFENPEKAWQELIEEQKARLKIKNPVLPDNNEF